MELWQKLHHIADRASPSFQREFLEAVAKSQSKVQMGLLVKALKTGDIGGAWKALKWEQVMKQEFTPALQRAFLNIIQSAGATAMADLIGGEMSFEVSFPQIKNVLQTETGLLITRINNQTRKGIVDAVQKAFADGLAPPKQQIFSILQRAANIRDSLGLNARQMAALYKYKVTMKQQSLSQAAYDKLVDRYRTNLLRDRADMIARTETIQTASEGQRQAWNQAVSKGHIDPRQWEVEWLITPDDITCKRCRTMRNARRPINGVYMQGEGRGTRGPTLHPRCRCGERLIRKRKAA